MSEDLTTFTRVPPQRRRDYDPWADPDYPLNRLAARDGAPRPPRRSPDRQSWPDVLNWRSHEPQRPLPPLTPEQFIPAAMFPPMYLMLGMAIGLRIAEAMLGRGR